MAPEKPRNGASIPNGDRLMIRDLAKRYAALASLPVHAETARNWSKLNRLERIRPLVWINEIPWNEMVVDEELRLQCSEEWCRGLEWHFREQLYRWERLRVDMVMDSTLFSPVLFHDSGHGIRFDVVRADHAFGANAFKPRIHGLRDVEAMRVPEIRPDPEATEIEFQKRSELLDGIMPVKRQGITHHLCNPWDALVQLYGLDKLLNDMIEEPELVHAAIRRFMEGVHARLDQLERLGLLSPGTGNHMVGTSSLAFTDELPQPGFDSEHVRLKDQWGYAMSQIFAVVSPAMHEEFALQYERPYLERFGLSGYGCCDPLHDKVAMLRSVRNLRVISMSPWINVERAARNMGADFVFAYKPNPSLVAMPSWDPSPAEKELRYVLDRTRGCRVALVLKDISTVCGEPRRLEDWCRMAMRVAGEYA